MDQKSRTGEAGKIPSRSDRFYLLEREWFFATREGSPVGPYQTREAASEGLGDYIEFLNLAKPKTRKKLVEAMEA